MNAPLMRSIAAGLADAEFAVLRFNFRAWGLRKVAGAKGWPRWRTWRPPSRRQGPGFPTCPLESLAGRSAPRRPCAGRTLVGSDLPYAGIAPPLSLSTGSALPAANDLSPARRIFIIGDRDQFAASTTSRRMQKRSQRVWKSSPGATTSSISEKSSSPAWWPSTSKVEPLSRSEQFSGVVVHDLAGDVLGNRQGGPVLQPLVGG